jgi:hypothetical protein
VLVNESGKVDDLDLTLRQRCAASFATLPPGGRAVGDERASERAVAGFDEDDLLDARLAELGMVFDGGEPDGDRSADLDRLGDPQRAAQLAAALTIAGFVTVTASVLLVWVSASVGARTEQQRGYELGPVPVIAVGLALTAAIATSIDLLRRGRRSSPVGRAASMTLAALSILGLVALESAASLIPEELLAVTVRRLSVGLAPGLGLWLVAIASAAMAVASSGLLGGRSGVIVMVLDDWIEGRRRQLAALGLLIAATVALGFARYEPWALGSSGVGDIEIAGWAVPWIGPATSILLWCLVGASLAVLVRPSALASLVTAALGWAVTFTAALTIVAVAGAGRLQLGRWLADVLGEEVEARTQLIDGSDLVRYAPQLDLAPGGWWAFAAGVAVIVAAALSLPSPEEAP